MLVCSSWKSLGVAVLLTQSYTETTGFAVVFSMHSFSTIPGSAVFWMGQYAEMPCSTAFSLHSPFNSSNSCSRMQEVTATSSKHPLLQLNPRSECRACFPMGSCICWKPVSLIELKATESEKFGHTPEHSVSLLELRFCTLSRLQKIRCGKQSQSCTLTSAFSLPFGIFIGMPCSLKGPERQSSQNETRKHYVVQGFVAPAQNWALKTASNCETWKKLSQRYLSLTSSKPPLEPRQDEPQLPLVHTENKA